VHAKVLVAIPASGEVEEVPNPFWHILAYLYWVQHKVPRRIELSSATPRPAHTHGVAAQELAFLAMKTSGLCGKQFAESILHFIGNNDIGQDNANYSWGNGWMCNLFRQWMRTSKLNLKQVLLRTYSELMRYIMGMT
jgi:hypothetical protein